jgi:hypothetical protein
LIRVSYREEYDSISSDLCNSRVDSFGAAACARSAGARAACGLCRGRTMPLTTRGTQTAFPATDDRVPSFRKLILTAVLHGALAGLLLFAVQHFTIVPLIHTAERYEAAAHHVQADAATSRKEWHPEQGWQRISLTAAATVLSSIGMAAILFGSVAFAGRTLTVRTGVLWGLAASSKCHHARYCPNALLVAHQQ